jgi:alanine racemase
MGRIGVRFDEVGPFAEHLKKYRHLRLEGLMTHFAAADDLGENKFTDLQIKRFNEAAAVFAGQGFNPFYKDLANSPGAIVHPESRGNLVRLGGILYGLGDDVLPAGVEKPDLKPVMSLKTAVAHLKRVPRGETLGYGRTFATPRDSIIATIPIGYEDGVPRLLSNRGKVLINGVFAPMVGRVSMDWTLVDVTDVPKVNVEDEVILIGQQNNFKITAEEWALLTGTISYEITCGINRRVLREYVSSQ